MKNLHSNNTLIGRKIKIRLEHTDKETLEKLRRPIPEMPTITGILIRRFYFFGWGYVVELDKPLMLDIDGIIPEARKKISTSYLMVYYFSTDIYNGKDPLYLELTGRASRVIKNGELHIILRYVKNPDEVPNEIGKNDQFLKDNSGVTSGYIKLID